MIKILIAAALLNGIPADIFVAMCDIESGLNPSVINYNDGGEDSIGLCQIKLSTARDMGFKGQGYQLLNPSTNAKYAARYFKHHMVKNGGNIVDAVIAYNAGRSIKYRRYADKVFAKAIDHHVRGD